MLASRRAVDRAADYHRRYVHKYEALYEIYINGYVITSIGRAGGNMRQLNGLKFSNAFEDVGLVWNIF